MNREQARELIINTFERPFDENKFSEFLINLFKKNYTYSPFNHSGILIPDPFKNIVAEYRRLFTYTHDNTRIDALVVRLTRDSSVERARSAQRNFVAGYLKGKYGTKSSKDAALVAFVSPDEEDWRFSFVKLDYGFDESGKVIEDLTPAKRFSYLVGKNEKSHTAQSRFLPIIEDDEKELTLQTLEEVFSVEVVTDEFYDEYRNLFVNLKRELDEIVKNDEKIRKEFASKNINTVDFAKKLLGQIVFLYFIQKKGWFGVPIGQPWGTGPKNFMRLLFEKKYCDYDNFFNKVLEPLFYEALSTDRSHADHYYSRFNCKIPFLNGGLFDPINNYDWVNTDIVIPNEIFSNTQRTKEGDIGGGILDVFDRFNFTVNEEEPLDKEVALDPELLGKIYEKLNAIRDDNFDEYYKVVRSRNKGEETKFNKEHGVYYTPREIVHYMCRESLLCYLETELNGKVPKEDLEKLISYADTIRDVETVALEKDEKIKSGEQKTTKYKFLLPRSIRENAKLIDDLLANIKICDPAVGSGAFPIGMMHEIVNTRHLLRIYLGENTSHYELKRHCIENSLYGVDIDHGAVETCRLRFWLSMIVDENDFHQIKPLPNLDYKVVCGDSLLGYPMTPLGVEEIEKLEDLYFNETNLKRKIELKKLLDEKIKQQLSTAIKSYEININFDFKIYFPGVFKRNKGFDIVIANPPYISTKGVEDEYKKSLLKIYKFADDTYNHFYFKGLDILKDNGFLCYISSKTFWTIQTKKNLRNLLLKYKIVKFVDTANPFESAMVDTCISIIKKQPADDDSIISFEDARKDINKPDIYEARQNIYVRAPNKVFFIPTPYNLKIYERLGRIVNELLNQWWDKISTSKNIEKNKKLLEEYRKTLKPGDITLLGLITEGGQGLATANNGKYIGVLEGTRWADNVRRQRPEKLLLAEEFCKKNGIKSKQDAEKYLNSCNEKEIRELFDKLKEKYGRDIFGQGWLYRIVSKEEIADVDKLTEDEKLNGIKGKKTFVPYDKGDKDGNRWYAPTPYYIDWSRENVKTLQTDPKARWQGYQFYFREGFCWTDVNSTYLKSRIKEIGVYDVLTMSLFTSTHVPDWYFVCLINSSFISEYVDDFVNSTSHFQINDARQLPIIIPNTHQLDSFRKIFADALKTQKYKFFGIISEFEAEKKLSDIQKELDEMVESMYFT